MDRKIEKKNWTWQKVALYIALLAGAGFLFSMIWKDAGTSKLNVETERLLIDTIHQGVFQEFIPVTGIVQPIKTVFIDAIEGGRVEEKFVEDGAFMKKGAPLRKRREAIPKTAL